MEKNGLQRAPLMVIAREINTVFVQKISKIFDTMEAYKGLITLA